MRPIDSFSYLHDLLLFHQEQRGSKDEHTFGIECLIDQLISHGGVDNVYEDSELELVKVPKAA